MLRTVICLVSRISQNFSPKDHCYTFIFFIANDILNYDMNLPLYSEITTTTSMVQSKPCFLHMKRDFDGLLFKMDTSHILRPVDSKERKRSRQSTPKELNNRDSIAARKKASSSLVELLNAIYQSPNKTIPTVKLLRMMKNSNQEQELIRIAEKRGYIVRYREKSYYSKKSGSSYIMNKLTLVGEGFLLSQCCRG
jgi:hypothetical protein